MDLNMIKYISYIKESVNLINCVSKNNATMNVCKMHMQTKIIDYHKGNVHLILNHFISNKILNGDISNKYGTLIIEDDKDTIIYELFNIYDLVRYIYINDSLNDCHFTGNIVYISICNSVLNNVTFKCDKLRYIMFHNVSGNCVIMSEHALNIKLFKCTIKLIIKTTHNIDISSNSSDIKMNHKIKNNNNENDNKIFISVVESYIDIHIIQSPL